MFAREWYGLVVLPRLLAGRLLSGGPLGAVAENGKEGGLTDGDVRSSGVCTEEATDLLVVELPVH